MRKKVKPGKALRQLPEAVHWVEIGRLSVSGKRIAVQLDSAKGGQRGLVQVVVISENTTKSDQCSF